MVQIWKRPVTVNTGEIRVKYGKPFFPLIREIYGKPDVKVKGKQINAWGGFFPLPPGFLTVIAKGEIGVRVSQASGGI